MEAEQSEQEEKIFTRRTAYTLENWRTKEKLACHIPDQVFEYTFETILKTLMLHQLGKLNVYEIAFALAFLADGWRVYRLPLNLARPSHKYIACHLLDYFKIQKDALQGKGVPDFIITRLDGNFRFIEVKVTEKTLRKEQVEWADRFPYEYFVLRPD